MKIGEILSYGVVCVIVTNCLHGAYCSDSDLSRKKGNVRTPPLSDVAGSNSSSERKQGVQNKSGVSLRSSGMPRSSMKQKSSTSSSSKVPESELFSSEVSTVFQSEEFASSEVEKETSKARASVVLPKDVSASFGGQTPNTRRATSKVKIAPSKTKEGTSYSSMQSNDASSELLSERFISSSETGRTSKFISEPDDDTDEDEIARRTQEKLKEKEALECLQTLIQKYPFIRLRYEDSCLDFLKNNDLEVKQRLNVVGHILCKLKNDGCSIHAALSSTARVWENIKTLESKSDARWNLLCKVLKTTWKDENVDYFCDGLDFFENFLKKNKYYSPEEIFDLFERLWTFYKERVTRNEEKFVKDHRLEYELRFGSVVSLVSQIVQTECELNKKPPKVEDTLRWLSLILDYDETNSSPSDDLRIYENLWEYFRPKMGLQKLLELFKLVSEANSNEYKQLSFITMCRDELSKVGPVEFLTWFNRIKVRSFPVDAHQYVEMASNLLDKGYGKPTVFEILNVVADISESHDVSESALGSAIERLIERGVVKGVEEIRAALTSLVDFSGKWRMWVSDVALVYCVMKDGSAAELVKSVDDGLKTQKKQMTKSEQRAVVNQESGNKKMSDTDTQRESKIGSSSSKTIQDRSSLISSSNPNRHSQQLKVGMRNEKLNVQSEPGAAPKTPSKTVRKMIDDKQIKKPNNPPSPRSISSNRANAGKKEKVTEEDKSGTVAPKARAKK